VGWTETANISTVVYDTNYIGYACAFNSLDDVEILLHATGEAGLRFIDLYPTIDNGKETRPLDFHIPQLSYADDHPGEDPPRFRFAFEVTGPNPIGQ
jgi:hypothetical protein